MAKQVKKGGKAAATKGKAGKTAKGGKAAAKPVKKTTAKPTKAPKSTKKPAKPAPKPAKAKAAKVETFQATISFELPVGTKTNAATAKKAFAANFALAVSAATVKALGLKGNLLPISIVKAPAPVGSDEEE